MFLICSQLYGYRNEWDNLELEKEEVLRDLRLIESRTNQTKDEYTIEGLSTLGNTKCKSYHGILSW